MGAASCSLGAAAFPASLIGNVVPEAERKSQRESGLGSHYLSGTHPVPAPARRGPLLCVCCFAAAVLMFQCGHCCLLLLQPDPEGSLAQRAAGAELRGEDSSALWTATRRLAPRSALIGVHAALSLERNGHVAAAERILLETERVNRLWLPRWSLASFYLRNHRAAEAARWGRLALDRSHTAVRPGLFALLEQAGVPSETWLAWCNRRPECLSSALDYLGAGPQRPIELAAAAGLLASLGPGSAPALWRDSLKAACARLIRVGHGPAAVRSWNELVNRGLLPYQPVSESNLIGNPGFAEPVDGAAFNWRYPPVSGVSRIFDPESRSVRIRFDGSQPESCQIISAPVWLAPGRAHRFTCLYRAETGPDSSPGPVWLIGAASSRPIAASDSSASADWRRLVFEIPAAPPGSPGRIAGLTLALVRQRGFVRAAGAVEIREPRLECLP